MRDLRGDSEGAAEVVGYLLVFGILSIVLVLSMSAFTVAQETARSRVVSLRAESAAARVAGVVVQTALLAEQQGTSAAVAYRVDLPQQLEGLDYTVSIEPKSPAGCTTACTNPDRVRVRVPAVNVDVKAPVFSAAAASTVDICPTAGQSNAGQTPGGHINVRFHGTGAAPVSPTPAVRAGCTTNQLFLEAAA